MFAAGTEYFLDKDNKSGYTDGVADKYKIKNIDFNACGEMGETYKEIVKSEEEQLNKDKQKLDAAQAFYDSVERAESSAVLIPKNGLKFRFTIAGKTYEYAKEADNYFFTEVISENLIKDLILHFAKQEIKNN